METYWLYENYNLVLIALFSVVLGIICWKLGSIVGELRQNKCWVSAQIEALQINAERDEERQGATHIEMNHIRATSVNGKRLASLLINHLGLEVRPGGTTTTEDKLVKKTKK